MEEPRRRSSATGVAVGFAVRGEKFRGEKGEKKRMEVQRKGKRRRRRTRRNETYGKKLTWDHVDGTTLGPDWAKRRRDLDACVHRKWGKTWWCMGKMPCRSSRRSTK